MPRGTCRCCLLCEEAARISVRRLSMSSLERCVGVIPCLNEAATIEKIVRETLRYLPAVIVVDDGSSDATPVFASRAGAVVIAGEVRCGKGSALAKGFRRAREMGYAWAVALDGDGQHAPGDIPELVRRAEITGARMVVGNRMGSAGQMPLVRRWVNCWMSERLSAYAGVHWPDSQCGFRLVNLDSWAQSGCTATHFEIESELLVRFAAAGHRIEFVPIATRYGGERSKIRPLSDTWRWFRWWHATRRELGGTGSSAEIGSVVAQTNG
jgi:glycosyltransferase involved in cell wall biosynthesis